MADPIDEYSAAYIKEKHGDNDPEFIRLAKYLILRYEHRLASGDKIELTEQKAWEAQDHIFLQVPYRKNFCPVIVKKLKEMGYQAEEAKITEGDYVDGYYKVDGMRFWIE